VCLKEIEKYRYPLAYTLQTLPLSIVRWTTFLDHMQPLAEDPTFGGYAAAHLIFFFVYRLSGFVNVVLVLTTRPNILLFGSRGLLSPDDPRAKAELEILLSPNVGSQVTNEKPEVHSS
jgi:hypothetical protein